MKKISAILAFVASVVLFMPSCVKEDVPGGDIGGEEILPKPDGPSEDIEPDEQKVKLENVAVNMMDICQADDFRWYMDLVDRFLTLYLDNEDYDFSAITDMAEDSLDKMFTQTENEVFNKLTNEFIRESIDNFTLVLSQHTGEYYFAEDGVMKTSSDEDALRVIVPIDDQIYIAELRQSGEVTTAFYNYEDYWEYSGNSGYWDSAKGEYVNIYPGTVHEFNTLTGKFVIGVPERIDICLAHNAGPAVADISLEFSCGFTTEGLDPSVDNFNVKTIVSLDNAYSIESRKIKYDGAEEMAGASIEFKKDGMALVTAIVSCDAKVKNSVHEYDRSNETMIDKGVYTSVEVVRLDNMSLVIDVLGQVQIRGNCQDGLEFSRAWEEWEDAQGEATDSRYYGNPVDTDMLDSATSAINAAFDLGVYYDMGDNRQAKLEFEWECQAQQGDGWMSFGYNQDLVIVFDDGSRYAFEDYFTEEAFSYMFEVYESFVDDYEDLLGVVTTY